MARRKPASKAVDADTAAIEALERALSLRDEREVARRVEELSQSRSGAEYLSQALGADARHFGSELYLPLDGPAAERVSERLLAHEATHVVQQKSS
jgi:hypothetical protein